MADSTVLGIHVTGRTMRRAELVRREGRTEVVRLEAVPFPDPSGGAPPSEQPAMDRPSLNGSRLVAAMPAADVMSRCWQLPQVDDRKLRPMVAHQLEADLPVPLDQIAWDCRRALQTDAGDGRCMVVAQAARSERVAQYLTALSAAGISVDLLTTEAEGLAGLYRRGIKAPGTQTEALVLAGPDEWLVCVFAGGLARAVRRIRVDDAMPETACHQFRQIIRAGPLPGEVKRIRWCAACPQPELPTLLAEFCGIPVEPAEPSDELALPGGERLTESQLAEFGPAIGLALAWPADTGKQLIRLAGRELVGAAKPLDRLERVLTRPWTWSAVAAALLIAAVTIHVASLRSQTRRMQAAIEHGSTSTTALDELKPKIRAMQRLERFRIDVEGICTDICAAVKDPITISSLQLSREHRLTIKGTAKDPKAIFTFADDLRKSNRLKNINLERTSPGQGGDFVISLQPTGFERLSSPALRGAR